MANDDLAGPHRCPTCDAPAKQKFRPFCSKRCQDLDLGRWLRGSYRVPTDEAPGESEPGAAERDEDDNPFGGRA